MKVCLNMIVRDEAHVIERCLASVRDHIDYWVIADTGSTDETPKLVAEILKGVPGIVRYDPWLNFGHNRSEVLRASRGMADYHLIIDADETFEPQGDFRADLKGADSYQGQLVYANSGWSFYRPMFLRDACEWRYEGVAHNYPVAAKPTKNGKGQTRARILHHNDGATWASSDKYLRNAKLFLGALEKNPQDARSQFYLGESYRDAKEPDLAIEAYRKRIALGGWPEEVFWSYYQIGALSGCVDDLLAAYNYRPSRAEPLFLLGNLERAEKRHHSAILFYGTALSLPVTRELFADQGIIWRVIDGLSLSLYRVGRFKEALALMDKLLTMVPEGQRVRIEENRRWCLKHLAG